MPAASIERLGEASRQLGADRRQHGARALRLAAPASTPPSPSVVHRTVSRAGDISLGARAHRDVRDVEDGRAAVAVVREEEAAGRR